MIFPSRSAPRHVDSRGFFIKVFTARDGKIESRSDIQQVNVSTMIHAGTLKGIHWQTGEFAEYRQVACLVGKVFDVAVDIRPESPTFLQWQGFELEGLDGQSVLIPPGYGHAIQALSDNCMVHCIHSSTYEPAH